MTTASALEDMTDRARFELLATSVLRAAEPKYAAIIHTGLNSQGETVVSPIDGIHVVPGSDPPHWVVVQHTTYDKDRLRGKWLSESDSDLVKVTRELGALRSRDPSIRSTVVLTTNQRPKTDLVVDVHRYAAEHGFTLDIWEQSRLASFLDDTPAGHWLRKQHLGLRTELLSPPLLHAIGVQSLEIYRSESRCPGTGLVARAANGTVVEALRDDSKSLMFLVGRSGFGKSVVAAQVLETWLTSGRLGLWLPATLITTSVESALNHWLRELCPDIDANAAPVAFELGAARGGLLVCVDDVNRCADPGRILRLIYAGAQRATAAKSGRGRRATFIVPIWPGADAALPPDVHREAWTFAEYIEGFSETEADAAIASSLPGATAEEVSAIARRLAGDPFLTGLFGAAAKGSQEMAALRAAADDATSLYVSRCVTDVVAAGTAGIALPEEVQASLRFMATMMLERHTPMPEWGEVAGWCESKPDILASLRACARHSGLFSVDMGGTVRFRHDRLREWLLSQAATALLLEVPPPVSALADPYFAPAVAESLLDSAVPLAALRTLVNRAPWLSFAALPLVRDWGTERVAAILDSATRWATTESGAAGDAVLTAISWSLFATDSPRAVRIIDELPDNLILDLAGLRNGSARHGIAYCGMTWGRLFEPGATDTRRDRIVAHARARYAGSMAIELRSLATSDGLTAAQAAGVAALIGHLRLPGFDDLLRGALGQYGPDMLIYRLWMALRCPLADPPATLKPLLDELAALPLGREPSESSTAREGLLMELPSALRDGVSASALPYLLSEGVARPDLRADISLLIEGSDDPAALEFVVRHLAAGAGSRLWQNLLSLSDSEPPYLPRSQASIARLRSLWESTTEPTAVRRRAFAMWLRAEERANLEDLRVIGKSSPLYRDALQHRIKLADPTSGIELIAVLRSDARDSFWWRLAHRVWSAELRAYASEVLVDLAGKIPADFSGGRSDLVYDMAAALLKIPLADAEAILEASWSHLRFSRVMIHVAFRVGTDRCFALARLAVEECPLAVDIFEHAFSSLYWSHGRSDNPTALRHLKALEPHLARMTEPELLSLAWATERETGVDPKVTSWVRASIVPRISAEERRRVNAASDRLLEELDRAFEATRFPLHLGVLFGAKHGRSLLLTADEIAQTLDEWLSTHATLRGLRVAGECLRHFGRREDLDVLNKYAISDADASDVDAFKSDVRFAVMSRSWS